MRLDAFNLGDIIANNAHFDAEAFIALAAEQAAKPVAFVVCKPKNTLTEDAVREYSRSHLAVFQHPSVSGFSPAGAHRHQQDQSPTLTALA